MLRNIKRPGFLTRAMFFVEQSDFVDKSGRWEG